MPQHILLVDDEKHVLDISSQMLELLGYDVSCSESGEDALALFQENQSGFDLMMIDMNMPGMSGLALFNQIQKISPEQKVLFCTGEVDSSENKEQLTLQKPYRLAELKNCLTRLLG
jgi:DNA-binding NtrC family response regulator